MMQITLAKLVTWCVLGALAWCLAYAAALPLIEAAAAVHRLLGH